MDEEPHPEDLVKLLQSAKLYESDYSSGEDNKVALIENDLAKTEFLNLPSKVGNISTTLLLNSGRPCSNLNWSLASQVVKSSPHTFWIHEKVNPQLRTFSNDPIHIEVKIQSPITSNDWNSYSATFLIGRDLFDQLGLAVTKS